jgi:hypothetical protein
MPLSLQLTTLPGQEGELFAAAARLGRFRRMRAMPPVGSH